MKRNQLFLALAAALGSAAALGCGDNSRQCGAGTADMNGVCVGINDPIMCTDGTVLNDEMTGCVIDPNACQDGTVLVGDACVDPGHIPETITEGMEPNGIGLFGEASGPEGAGAILVPAVGGAAFVIKGKIEPFQDLLGGPPDTLTGLPTPDGQLDVDIDTYNLEVSGPVLLNISADGLHGLAAGFVALNTDVPQLLNWTRFGINVNADTSKRQLFLPAAGRYIVGIADTRSLFLTGAAAGAEPDADPFEYYVSITQLAIAPASITITDGAGTATGELQPGEVKLFSATLGEGLSTVTYGAPAEQMIESLVVTNTSGGVTSLRAVVDRQFLDEDPAATLLGIKTGDTTVFAADHVFNYASQPIPFTVTVDSGEAGALSTNGMTVTQPVGDDEADFFGRFSVFHYDVATDGEITGMDLTWDRPVSGVVIDQDLFIVGAFTFDTSGFCSFFFGDPFGCGDTFSDYVGLLRHQTAGRYYFFVFDPVAGDTADIAATSTYAPVTPAALVKGTPSNDVAPNAFESNPFSYAADVGTDAWQQFNAGGTSSGTVTLRYFNPAQTTIAAGFGFGRLDDLVCGNVDPTVTGICTDDVIPIFTTTHVEAGTTTVGRILLNDQTSTYLVTANTATVTAGTTTFDMSFARRDHIDLGTLAANATATQDNVVLDTTTTVQRVLVRTTAGNSLRYTVTPNDALLNTRGQQLNNNESNRGGLLNNGLVGLPDTFDIIQNAEQWTAITVTAATPIVGGTFDLSVQALPPPYVISNGATAFSDACTGGTVVTMEDADEGFSTTNVTPPAGFDFFGAPVGDFQINSNGFVTFNLALNCSSIGASCFFGNAAMPSAAQPNGIIAPNWDDIVNDSVCTKVDGTKLIIQWQGATFGAAVPVQFQAILDGSNDTIEFVYGPGQVGNGSTASIGVENVAGDRAVTTGVNTAGSIAPNTSDLYTPQ